MREPQKKWSSDRCLALARPSARSSSAATTPLVFRGGIRQLSPQVDAHELPFAVRCLAACRSPGVCVSLSLWPPRRASDKNASTGCLYTSSLLERGERKKGRKREEREVERGKEKERTRGTRQQLGGRRKEEEEGERKEEDGGSPCSRGSRSGTSPGGSGSRSRRCW